MLTTCEYVHFVTCGHFRSRDKDGGDTVRSALSKKPMLHANIMAVCFIEPALLPIEVLHWRIGIFDLFCSWDVDLDQMTFIYELDPYSLEMHGMCENEISTSRLSEVIVWQTDRQTRPKLSTTQLRGWSIVILSTGS